MSNYEVDGENFAYFITRTQADRDRVICQVHDLVTKPDEEQKRRIWNGPQAVHVIADQDIHPQTSSVGVIHINSRGFWRAFDGVSNGLIAPGNLITDQKDLRFVGDFRMKVEDKEGLQYDATNEFSRFAINGDGWCAMGVESEREFHARVFASIPRDFVSGRHRATLKIFDGPHWVIFEPE